ncbi:rhamnogalacturonan acetylesterase [Sphingomonas sp. 2R-10]|uniref:rhamnogalacturonan acetylesterase n=1 Tax=Sphingomonas sp. 2R-10 TaxID=3045148 RepID=UPI000F7A7E63|nr:rhamnogalacturonan acetylesterase [Sphingomonas sp. 2R-10]MDJ0275852.1 rhamnogalacturonan acetylesterase [Sphingomonas sp. 2R-10]
MIAAIALLLAGPAGVATYRLDDAPRQPGETAVARDRPYRGDHGYEPGGGRRFSVALPEGNWRVTVTLGGKRAAATTIKAEARRLMLDRVATRAGQRVTRSFVVNTRTPALAPPPPGAPGGPGVRLKPAELASATWDDRLTLELSDDAAVATVRIEPAEVPTLYLVGDSTVTDQPSEPAASWGQMLPAMVGERVAVANHAESGETLKSFLTGLRLDKVLSVIRPGDWLLIQFGHNDQKRQWPQTFVEAGTTYRSYLKTYIAEARRRGARPVLVTSPERRNFDAAGRITPTLGDYPAAVRAVAVEERVPLIDLNRASVALYEALGPTVSPQAFNDGGRDRTHHDNYGAWLLARAVAEGMRTIPGLAPAVTAAPFDPSRPPPPEAVAIVPSAGSSTVRPDGS